MPSEKVTQILKSKSSLSDSEIEQLSERDAWGLVYNLERVKKPKRPTPTSVCFTGFSPTDKEQLEHAAADRGLHIARSVTKSLDFLVTGSNAGPAKLKKAREQGVIVMNESEFHRFLEGGELPVTPPDRNSGEDATE